ncbi:adenylyltransferase/cytidyltransferase family protein [Geomicrobium sediminis]|uniref:FAD synthase n=1 Tax=Geomicrobium sediminis TaxID=1347788 RepID=A0ABS2PAE4_9BACL|nr:adenylyltransferase/cytidyltransferase family protein [Geomicrobium sediminis]MBM7632282.1 riboflavin kinase/FMN adenylyltransferase [Geomicrobium sediminis]
MKVSYNDTPTCEKSVVTIGAFDGLHLGHQELIAQSLREARRMNVPLVVYTFDPPPKVFLHGQLQLLSLDQKITLLKQYGVDTVIVATFNEQFMLRTVDEFIQYIQKLNPVSLWMGDDFRFGKNREGDVKTLQQSFNVQLFSKLTCEKGIRISSTRIRSLFKEGNSNKASQLLGRVSDHTNSKGVSVNDHYSKV